jgi:hypothetical protein
MVSTPGDVGLIKAGKIRYSIGGEAKLNCLSESLVENTGKLHFVPFRQCHPDSAIFYFCT